ncbi:MAG: DNA-binding protein Alba [Methanocorpusculum parvum]|nr:DNA-binding protein Alba [Methanocorpusculum parvum]
MQDNIIFVGTKPVMNYCLAVVTQFNSGADEVIIKARGKSIVRAVDTVEIVIRQFLPDVVKKHVSISTDSVETDAGTTNVSSIEIILGH